MLDDEYENERKPITRALISVSDKSNLSQFARDLNGEGIEILSTGGTSKFISDCGVKVKNVEEITKFPEIMNGRVKTLHPLIFGGILGRDSDKSEIDNHKISLIDIVVCNLYPFWAAASKGVDLESLIEEIDIGGPSLIRAASKNYNRVAVIVDIEDYAWISKEIGEGGLKIEQRRQLALKAFRYTSYYDTMIQNELRRRFNEEDLPSSLHITGIGTPPLRYGENPHQSAIFYSNPDVLTPSVTNSIQVQGKNLSYNNLLDFDSALSIISEFRGPCAVIVKHNNPCGVACSTTLYESYELAVQTDEQSSFGGIVALNREVDEKLSRLMLASFKEGLIAPSFTKEALRILSEKPNLRILQIDNLQEYRRTSSLRSLEGGWLWQEPDDLLVDVSNCKVVSKRKPTSQELTSLQFGWQGVKHVKSNAIVFTKNQSTLGIGAGQMSRIDALKLAILKSPSDFKDVVMSSDAFFPFRDCIDEAAKFGITAIIQPGGSIRDQEVIDAANEHNIAMLFTGVRHFKH